MYQVNHTHTYTYTHIYAHDRQNPDTATIPAQNNCSDTNTAIAYNSEALKFIMPLHDMIQYEKASPNQYSTAKTQTTKINTLQGPTLDHPADRSISSSAIV